MGVWNSGYHSPFELQEYETEEQRDERLRTTELVAMKREDRRSQDWRIYQRQAASPSDFWSVSNENPEWKTEFYEQARRQENLLPFGLHRMQPRRLVRLEQKLSRFFRGGWCDSSRS